MKIATESNKGQRKPAVVSDSGFLVTLARNHNRDRRDSEQGTWPFNSGREPKTELTGRFSRA